MLFTSSETVRTIRDGHLDFHSARALSTFHIEVQCCFTSTETIRTFREWVPRMATPTFTQLLSSASVQCCFTSTETIRTIRDWEPRMATPTFTQLLSSEIILCFDSQSFVWYMYWELLPNSKACCLLGSVVLCGTYARNCSQTVRPVVFLGVLFYVIHTLEIAPKQLFSWECCF